MLKQKKMFLVTSCLIYLSLTSCSESYLSIYSDYLTPEHLASYHVNTPDPRSDCPSIGQRLIVTWSMPKNYKKNPNLYLDVHIKFRDLSEIRESQPIFQLNGTYIYSLLDQNYWEKKGFLTYQVFLMDCDSVIQEWRHVMWIDFITIESDFEEEKVDFEEDDESDLEFMIPLE